MEAMKLTAQARTETGKGAARQLRRDGFIPAVYYGPDKPAQGIKVSPKELTHALSGDHGRNQLIALQLDGGEALAVVQEVQVHPLTREPLHVDFLAVTPQTVVERKVPFETNGRAKGVLLGGELRQLFRHVPVTATPDKIPAKIAVDVSQMDIGAVVKVKDIPLPEGAVINMPDERNLVTLSTSRRRGDKRDEEGEEAAAS